MKLSEIKNEDALDTLADILEPATAIIGDTEIKKMYQEKELPIKIAKYIIKNHKNEILDILARIEGVPREEFKCTLITLPSKIIELINDEELVGFFTSSASLD